MTVVVPESIFRAYDIRGLAESELTDGFTELLGRVHGQLVREAGGSRASIGYDARLSSPRLAAALERGMRSAGVQVVRLGMVPTPVTYFSVFAHELDGGVQVTGSHNPPEFNGFKMLVGRDALHGDGVLALRERMLAELAAGWQPGAPAQGWPEAEDVDVRPAYLDAVLARVRPGSRRLRVVLDAGNGAAGPLGVEVLERMGVEVIGHCIEPDGRFPHHHPDPTTVENVALLGRLVREHGADVAIGFDGDGDRIGVVDERGDVLWGDRLLMVFARALLAERPGATVLGEVKCSASLFRDIAARGGEPVMCRVGHSVMKAEMKARSAALAGEMSGHIFFADRWFGFDDATYAAARLIELLQDTERPLGALLEDVPQTFVTPEIRVDCADDVKFAVVDRVRDALTGQGDVVAIDGVRVEWPDGWGLVRASNTQPALVLRAEATSEDRRDDIVKLLRQTIDAATLCA